ncbi:uncharacterized protein PRCAT00003822001 [Priceomyces carsonii]|uniref:uncharacterized protein n=1 Tax=Priceomyces carsonii TaxID=28549 RepID=UPI002EDA9AE3|nr:unnamed protein product [Priceomyces carsonii]
MSDCSSKDESDKEYSMNVTTSAESNLDPIMFTGTEGNKAEKKLRSNSSTSLALSVDSIRRSIGGRIPRNSISSNLSVKDVFRNLDSTEIEKKRESARAAIINEVSTRALFQNQISEPNDLEKYLTNDTFVPGAIESVPIRDDGSEFNKVDPELITWEGKDDPQDPKNWRISTKLYLLLLVSLYALVAPMSSSMLSPAMPQISQAFGIESQVISAMVVSIQILAWAFGPLLIAPFSEDDRFGRKIVLDICVWMSLFFNLGCAFSQNTAQMMVFRFIGGLFGCVPMNVCAGVIADMFDALSRNLALSGYSLAPVLGPVIAPLISGFIIEHMEWRWVFYVLCMFNGTVAILALLFFKETYAPKLLKLKAKKLRKETGNEHLHTIFEITDVETATERVFITMTRPIELLFTHPMIVGLGSFMAFTYGFMYLMIVTFPTIFKQNYGFSSSVTGLMYLPMGVGFILGLFLWTYLIGRTYKKLTAKNGGIPKPEYRLPCLLGSSVCVPVGLLWFGWSAQTKIHWIMPGIGSAIFAMGLVCVFQTIQNYLIDMNYRYAASSVAAAALFRSLFGFAFPLFAGKMYDRLGYGWANTMCALVSILLGVPFPILCICYGERIRGWADKRIERRQNARDKKRIEKLKSSIN